MYLSYLPLGHLYERSNFVGSLNKGFKVGLFNGDLLKLRDDILTLRPTVFASVPRLYNKFYEAFTQKIATLPQKKQDKLNGLI